MWWKCYLGVEAKQCVPLFPAPCCTGARRFHRGDEILFSTLYTLCSGTLFTFGVKKLAGTGAPDPPLATVLNNEHAVNSAQRNHSWLAPENSYQPKDRVKKTVLKNELNIPCTYRRKGKKRKPRKLRPRLKTSMISINLPCQKQVFYARTMEKRCLEDSFGCLL